MTKWLYYFFSSYGVTLTVVLAIVAPPLVVDDEKVGIKKPCQG